MQLLCFCLLLVSVGVLKSSPSVEPSGVCYLLDGDQKAANCTREEFRGSFGPKEQTFDGWEWIDDYFPAFWKAVATISILLRHHLITYRGYMDNKRRQRRPRTDRFRRFSC